jgi:transposase
MATSRFKDRENIHSQFLLGFRAITHGLEFTADMMIATIGQTRYWREKLVNPDFHPKTCGGAYHCLDEYIAFLMEFLVYFFTQKVPQLTAWEMMIILRDGAGFQIDDDAGRRHVNRIWERWGYTSKKATFRNINKYTEENSEYYVMYRALILTFHWQDILFYDETSFNEREMFRRRARSLRGERAYAVKETFGLAADNSTFNMGVMTDLSSRRGFHILNVEAHAQDSFNFVDAMICAVERRIVRNGSVVVFDNSRIHSAEHMFDFVAELFRSVGALIIFLPSYSPELQPCELLFGSVKNRVYRTKGNGSLLEEVASSFRLVSREQVINMYKACILEAIEEY